MERKNWKQTGMLALVAMITMAAIWSTWGWVMGEIPDSSFRFDKNFVVNISRFGDVIVVPFLILAFRFWLGVIRMTNEATIKDRTTTSTGLMGVAGGMGAASSLMALVMCFAEGTAAAVVITAGGFAIALWFVTLALIAILVPVSIRQLKRACRFVLAAL